MFGELALLYNTPRQASVACLKDSVLLSLSRETFNAIVKQKVIKQREKFDSFLETVPLFSNLSVYERQKISDSLKSESFRA